MGGVSEDFVGGVTAIKKTCKKCKGTGKIPEQVTNGNITRTITRKCPACGGKGKKTSCLGTIIIFIIGIVIAIAIVANMDTGKSPTTNNVDNVESR